MKKLIGGWSQEHYLAVDVESHNVVAFDRDRQRAEEVAVLKGSYRPLVVRASEVVVVNGVVIKDKQIKRGET